jgi:hypothetical protein
MRSYVQRFVNTFVFGRYSAEGVSSLSGDILYFCQIKDRTSSIFTLDITPDEGENVLLTFALSAVASEIANNETFPASNGSIPRGKNGFAILTCSDESFFERGQLILSRDPDGDTLGLSTNPIGTSSGAGGGNTIGGPAGSPGTMMALGIRVVNPSASPRSFRVNVTGISDDRFSVQHYIRVFTGAVASNLLTSGVSVVVPIKQYLLGGNSVDGKVERLKKYVGEARGLLAAADSKSRDLHQEHNLRLWTVEDFRHWNELRLYRANEPTFYNGRIFFCNPLNLPGVGESPETHPAKWNEMARWVGGVNDVDKQFMQTNIITPLENGGLMLTDKDVDTLNRLGYTVKVTSFPTQAFAAYHLDANLTDREIGGLFNSGATSLTGSGATFVNTEEGGAVHSPGKGGLDKFARNGNLTAVLDVGAMSAGNAVLQDEIWGFDHWRRFNPATVPSSTLRVQQTASQLPAADATYAIDWVNQTVSANGTGVAEFKQQWLETYERKTNAWQHFFIGAYQGTDNRVHLLLSMNSLVLLDMATTIQAFNKLTLAVTGGAAGVQDLDELGIGLFTDPTAARGGTLRTFTEFTGYFYGRTGLRQAWSPEAPANVLQILADVHSFRSNLFVQSPVDLRGTLTPVAESSLGLNFTIDGTGATPGVFSGISDLGLFKLEMGGTYRADQLNLLLFLLGKILLSRNIPITITIKAGINPTVYIEAAALAGNVCFEGSTTGVSSLTLRNAGFTDTVIPATLRFRDLTLYRDDNASYQFDNMDVELDNCLVRINDTPSDTILLNSSSLFVKRGTQISLPSTSTSYLFGGSGGVVDVLSIKPTTKRLVNPTSGVSMRPIEGRWASGAEVSSAVSKADDLMRTDVSWAGFYDIFRQVDKNASADVTFYLNGSTGVDSLFTPATLPRGTAANPFKTVGWATTVLKNTVGNAHAGRVNIALLSDVPISAADWNQGGKLTFMSADSTDRALVLGTDALTLTYQNDWTILGSVILQSGCNAGSPFQVDGGSELTFYGKIKLTNANAGWSVFQVGTQGRLSLGAASATALAYSAIDSLRCYKWNAKPKALVSNLGTVTFMDSWNAFMPEAAIQSLFTSLQVAETLAPVDLKYDPTYTVLTNLNGGTVTPIGKVTFGSAGTRFQEGDVVRFKVSVPDSTKYFKPNGVTVSGQSTASPLKIISQSNEYTVAGTGGRQGYADHGFTWAIYEAVVATSNITITLALSTQIDPTSSTGLSTALVNAGITLNARKLAFDRAELEYFTNKNQILTSPTYNLSITGGVTAASRYYRDIDGKITSWVDSIVGEGVLSRASDPSTEASYSLTLPTGVTATLGGTRLQNGSALRAGDTILICANPPDSQYIPSTASLAIAGAVSTRLVSLVPIGEAGLVSGGLKSLVYEAIVGSQNVTVTLTTRVLPNTSGLSVSGFQIDVRVVSATAVTVRISLNSSAAAVTRGGTIAVSGGSCSQSSTYEYNGYSDIVAQLIKVTNITASSPSATPTLSWGTAPATSTSAVSQAIVSLSNQINQSGGILTRLATVESKSWKVTAVEAGFFVSPGNVTLAAGFYIANTYGGFYSPSSAGSSATSTVKDFYTGWSILREKSFSMQESNLTLIAYRYPLSLGV